MDSNLVLTEANRSKYRSVGKPPYMCKSTEFSAKTEKEDGSSLIVVDDGSHKVAGYYIAFNGYWCSLT